MVLAEHIGWDRCSRLGSSVNETSLGKKGLVESMRAQTTLRVSCVQKILNKLWPN